jgi:hypothetical protein
MMSDEAKPAFMTVWDKLVEEQVRRAARLCVQLEDPEAADPGDGDLQDVLWVLAEIRQADALAKIANAPNG